VPQAQTNRQAVAERLALLGRFELVVLADWEKNSLLCPELLEADNYLITEGIGEVASPIARETSELGECEDRVAGFAALCILPVQEHIDPGLYGVAGDNRVG
jgi:hypothetical protein